MIYSIAKPVLEAGSNHSEVLEIQRLLCQTLRPIPLTGCFDYETEIAIKAFQSRMFLKPDGIVGLRTWQALYTHAPVGMPTLQQGCHGSAVIAVQELLSIDLYYMGAVDGVFGPELHQAVQKFQVDYGLPADGIVNQTIWPLLSEI